jgi:hypothetical protein
MILFNAKTQQDEETEAYVDHNNEIVATFADGSFVKFPAGLDKETLDTLIVEHKTANEGQEVITEEMETEAQNQRANSEALIEDKTNAPTPDVTE